MDFLEEDFTMRQDDIATAIKKMQEAFNARISKRIAIVHSIFETAGEVFDEGYEMGLTTHLFDCNCKELAIYIARRKIVIYECQKEIEELEKRMDDLFLDFIRDIKRESERN